MASARVIGILYLVFLTPFGYAAKILGVFPTAAPSHYILGNALLRGLAEAGHDVTMISPFTEKNPPKNGSWRDVVLTGFKEDHQENTKKVGGNLSENSSSLFLVFQNTQYSFAEKTLNHTNVQKLIRSDEEFDAVIIGEFFCDSLHALAKHFNGHLIILSTIGPNFMINHLVGNPSMPSFAPELLSTFPPKMSFIQRVQNTIFKFLITFMTHVLVYPAQDDLVKKYISKFINLEDVIYNASLILVNSHISISRAVPYVPCMVDIGGFHIKPTENLPKDLQTFLDNATHGVIYFSMGSNLQSKDLPVEKRDAILKVFSKLKQKVLWKFEDEFLPGQPPNVKLDKWLPQQSILAHPNVKVFITHGGLLSTTETLYHGVPIMVMPIFGDQKINAYAAEMGGYGIVLPFQELSEERLLSTLDEILSNPKYRDEARTRSRIMLDRQVKPLDNAVYWVEYVIRHNGAKHLRVPYLDLTWYQYYVLDVIAFILGVVLVAYLLMKGLVKYVISRTVKPKLKKN